MAKPDAAHRQTDRQLAALERRIAQLYRQAGEDLQGTIDAYFEQFKQRDEEMKALIGTVQNGKEWTEQDYKQWRLNQMARGERYQALRDRVARRMTDAKEEKAAVLKYKSSESYKVNAKLRDGLELTEQERRLVRSLDSALEKLPIYEGEVFRRVNFDLFGGEEALEQFAQAHQTGAPVVYEAFTSASTREDGYEVDGENTAELHIESLTARDVGGLGNNFEAEVVFPRNAVFFVDSVERTADGKLIVTLKEEKIDAGKHGQLYSEERGEVLQPVQASDAENGEMRRAPGRNSAGASGGPEEVPGVRGEGITKYSADDQSEKEKPQKAEKRPRKAKTTKPVAESRPIIAKKDFRQNMLNLFSIPAGMRAELGGYADAIADKILARGELSQQDRDAFFDRMYEAGVMEVAADEYMQEARKTVIGQRVYVPEGVKHEFADDWNEFRKRAFAAGVMLTNDRGDNGIDTFNAELAERLPGLFDAGDLDERSILERIVQTAEEGKSEKMSLAEYVADLAGENYVSEREVLDNMERQMDWALRTFTEKAGLEVKLRDRTGVKIAQEREKSNERARLERDRENARWANASARRQEMNRKQRERRQLQELQQKTLKQLQWLNKNQYRAPEELKGAWKDVLGDIDVLAVGAANEMNWNKRYGATWGDLAQMYKDAKENDPNFLPSQELENIVNRLDKTKIADMDIGALQDLYKAAVGLRTEFYNRNNVIGDEEHRIFEDVYADSKAEIESAPGGYVRGEGKLGKVKETADKLFNLDQLSPMNVMQRMVGWNPKSTFYSSMAKQLEKGERDIRAYTVKANQLLRDFLTEHEEWVKKADGQGKDAVWYEIEVPQLLELGMGDKPIFGPTVQVAMTPAQKVHMYLESKNYDNLRHMTKCGAARWAKA